MTREQRIVAIGAAAGLILMLVALWLLSAGLPPPSGVETAADRLAYAVRWIAVAALPLFAMVTAVGHARFFGAGIDPTRGGEGKAAVVDGRVADNTTQQFLLFAAGALGIAASLDPERMGVIRAAAIVFVAARLAFWIGYRLDPLYRAPGFAATAGLNLGLLLGALWLAAG